MINQSRKAIQRHIRKLEKKLLKNGGEDMSRKYSLDAGDLKSVGITVILAALSAGVATLIQTVPSINFGQSTEVITVVILGVLKVFQKWLSGR